MSYLGPITNQLATKLEINYTNAQNQKVEGKYEEIIKTLATTKDKQPLKWRISDLNPKYVQILKNKLVNDGFVVDLPNFGDKDRFGEIVTDSDRMFIYFNNDEIAKENKKWPIVFFLIGAFGWFIVISKLYLNFFG